MKARITVAADAAEEDIIAKALEAAANAVEGKTVIKKIVIPGRLVNIVCRIVGLTADDCAELRGNLAAHLVQFSARVPKYAEPS